MSLSINKLQSGLEQHRFPNFLTCFCSAGLNHFNCWVLYSPFLHQQHILLVLYSSISITLHFIANAYIYIYIYICIYIYDIRERERERENNGIANYNHKINIKEKIYHDIPF